MASEVTFPEQNAGTTVEQAQVARDDGAPVQTPAPDNIKVDPTTGRVAPNNNTIPTNANSFYYAKNTTTGTDAPSRKLSTTQTVPPPTAQPTLNSDPITAAATSIGQFVAGGTQLGGVGAIGSSGSVSSDDYGASVTSRINQIAASGQNAHVQPQGNILDKYSSYSYNISIYLLNQKDYSNMVNDKSHMVSGPQLLIQSGGAPISTKTVTGQTAPGRSQFFPLDFYIDEVKVKTLMPGKGTRGAYSSYELDIRIIEPNGISLLDNLFRAVKQYIGRTENYLSQNYLMVIRFYGYDQNGNLLPVSNANQTTVTGLTDQTAIVEKYIPFQFTNIKFRVANKLTEYECQAIVTQNNIASGQAAGTIPYNVELTASTLKDVFNGVAAFGTSTAANAGSGREATGSSTPPSANSSSSAPPKANAAPTKVVTSGIIDAINQYEKQHVSEGIFEIPHEYSVVFVDPVIANASTVPPGETDKSKTPMGSNATASQQVNPATQSMSTNSKNISATAGTSLLQFIDQTIKGSDYISSQQVYIIDPVTQKLVKRSNNAKAFGWYRVGMQVEPKGYDNKRNDYAYKITYQISPYLVSNLHIPWFPDGEFRGVQKQYYYWFTGQNTQILNYEQTFNAQFMITSNTPQSGIWTTADYRDVPKYSYQTRSNESDQGADGKTFEGAASAADRLYSPADLSKVNLSIVGDPAWIIQGEVWSGIAGTNFSYNPFLVDGTINPESQEPLFEILFNKPVDYDIGTGVIDPTQATNGGNEIISRTPSETNGPSQSYVYKAIQVTSIFSKGRFTQDLEGVLITFPVKVNALSAFANEVGNGRPTANAASTFAANGFLGTNTAGNAFIGYRNSTAHSGPGGTQSVGVKARATQLPDSIQNVDTESQPYLLQRRNARFAPAAEDPTSGTTNVRVTTPTQTTDLSVFTQNDPKSAEEFRVYVNQQERVLQPQIQAQLEAAHPGWTPSRIFTTSQLQASSQAYNAGLKQFAPQIQASGANSPVPDATNTTPQLISRDE